MKSATNLAQAPHADLPEICFCGRSNVGKSSLLNVLCNRRQLARVSSTPGRTQLINFFNVQDQLMMVDLPGYGWAKAPKSMKREWGQTIQGYLAGRPQLTLALLLVDARRTPTDDERNLLAWFADGGRDCLVVVTKIDKFPASKRALTIKAIARELGVPRDDVIGFSATERLGRDDVWGAILAAVAAPTDDAGDIGDEAE